MSLCIEQIVEASQDCVPLLVLTADRPHELRDTCANQTIDQVLSYITPNGNHTLFVLVNGCFFCNGLHISMEIIQW